MKTLKTVLFAIIIFTGCKTNKELNQLRKQYIKSNDDCNCNGIFEMPEKYKTLDAFPKAVELIDSIKNAENKRNEIVFFNDSLIRKKLTYRLGTPFAYIYIYNKSIHVLELYSYLKNHNIEFQSYQFYPSDIGKYVEYNSSGDITKVSYQNYFKYYTTVEEGEKIKKKYPICWREAYLLAKSYAGVNDDKESYRLTRGDSKDPNWYVGFTRDYKDIYVVNAKTGRVKE